VEDLGIGGSRRVESGNLVAAAQRAAYAAADAIDWDGEFHRHDIGWRAIARM
jgi:phosphoribosylamine--glycine ligase